MNIGKCYFQNSPCCSRFVALRYCEECLLRLRYHRAREVVLVDGVVFEE